MKNTLLRLVSGVLSFGMMASALAGDREIAFAGEGFGAAEVKSILVNVVGRVPDALQYVEFGSEIPVEEFQKFGVVVLATKVAAAYTAEQAQVMEAYVRQGGRVLLIHQAYRSIMEPGETEGMRGKGEFPHFESWLGKGRSYYVKAGLECAVNLPDDPLLAGVLKKNPAPVWLNGHIFLRNPEFENLIGMDDYILVGRKRVGSGTVYYLGSELFRMKLPQYKEKHADAVSWGQLIENILTDTSKGGE